MRPVKTSATFIAVAIAALTILIHGSAASLHGQDNSTEKSGAQADGSDKLQLPAGRLMELAPNVSDLIRINACGGLSIQRDWDARIRQEEEGQDPEEARQNIIEQHIERGLPKAMAIRRADMDIKREGSGIAKCYEKFLNNVDGFNSRGRSQSGDNCRYRAGGRGLECQLHTSGENIHFEFTATDVEESWRISDDGNGILRFRFISADSLIDYVQNSNKVRLAVIHQDDAKVFNARNFSELQSKHPDSLNSYLYPVLEHVGIERPLSYKEIAVQRAAAEKLRSTESDEQEVMVLIDELESDSFAAREKASVSLTENYFKWEILIKKLIKDREFASESQTRVNRILKDSAPTRAQGFVEDTGLYNSPEALVELLEYATDENHQLLVLRRLKKVTGKSFGDDVQAWKEWLVK